MLRVTQLKNKFCPFCGASLNESNGPTLEHVIGRRFIPKGFMDNEWNLILNACHKCNSFKGRLEDGVSAISMISFFDLEYDEDAKSDVVRKVRPRGATHPETRQPIIDSFPEFTVLGNVHGAKLSFGFIAPPQSRDAELHLVLMQMQAISFLLLNYDSQTGSPISDELEKASIMPIYCIRSLFPHSLPKSDWGNPRAKGLIQMTREWAPWFICSTAKGHFRIEIRRMDQTLFWAVEWNKNLRFLGIVCDPNSEDSIFDDLPNLNWHSAGNGMGFRTETAIDGDDYLFK